MWPQTEVPNHGCGTMKIPTLSKPVSAEHRPKFWSPSQRMATSQYKRYFLKRDNQSTLHGLIIITVIRKCHRYTIIYKRKSPLETYKRRRKCLKYTHLKCNSLKISARQLPEDQYRYVGKWAWSVRRNTCSGIATFCIGRAIALRTKTNATSLLKKNDCLIDWLSDWIVFYAVLAILQLETL